MVAPPPPAHAAAAQPGPGCTAHAASGYPLIDARGLTRAYSEAGHVHPVLTGIDLQVRTGELVVVLGRSGSGKSTLLNLIGAMDSADGGTLEVAGVRLDGLDEDARTRFRRRHIGFVFQTWNLIPTLTVAENLDLPLALNGFAGAARAQRIGSFLERLQIGDKAARFPDQLSGGEQQRVAIARALVHAPDLVIADEPTGNLDLDTGRRVLDLLDAVTRAEGRTLLMATHGREVIGMADRVLSIEHGRLVERTVP